MRVHLHHGFEQKALYMISVSRKVCLALACVVCGCASSDQRENDEPQRTSSAPLAGSNTAPPEEVREALEVDAPVEIEPVAPMVTTENSLDSEQGLKGLPLLAADEAMASDDTAAAPGMVAGDLRPNSSSEAPSLFHFVPFEAPAGVVAADFARWSEWLAERFLGNPDEARQTELDELIASAHIVDLTPAYINQVDGLDMADPDHVARAGELTLAWFMAQEKYKQVVIDRNVDDMQSATIIGRVTSLKAWVRWWQRTLENETVERYRSRVDELTARLRALRKERRGEL